jgi:hypothetical protein
VFLVGAIVALLLVRAPAALACSAAENHHCYSITSWEMSKAHGEEVLGAESELQTFYAKVPRWANGDRINNEMWVGLGGNKWVEGGATIGNGVDANSPHYFVAKNVGEQYWEFDYPGAGPPSGAWYALYLDEPEGPNGTWCATWRWDTQPDFCWGGLPRSSTDLEAGLEFATTPEAGAENNGQSVGWALWMDKSWHKEWAATYTHATHWVEKPLCNSAPSPGYTWGSVAFSEPGC